MLNCPLVVGVEGGHLGRHGQVERIERGCQLHGDDGRWRAVRLVDNGVHAATLQPGAVIAEDQTLPTASFQTTLNKFRQVLSAKSPAQRRQRRMADGLGAVDRVRAHRRHTPAATVQHKDPSAALQLAPRLLGGQIE